MVSNFQIRAKEVSEGAYNYLIDHFHYSISQAQRYRSLWEKFCNSKSFLSASEFNDKLMSDILKELRIDENNLYDPKFQVNRYTAISYLFQYAQFNYIFLREKRAEIKSNFTGLLGNTILSFIQYLEEVLKRKKRTLYAYHSSLINFYEFSRSEKIKSPDEVTLPLIFKYIEKLSTFQKFSSAELATRALRGYLKYLHKNSLIDKDLSKKVPTVKVIKKPKRQSVYTKDELLKIINVPDRSSGTGKRNYAILVLLMITGLRASDIANMKISDIDWDSSTITIYQFKTKKPMVIHMVVNVGNAIFDYLENARIKSYCNNVFLSRKPPKQAPVTSGTVTHVVQESIKKADVDIKGRKFGAHVFRHSLTYHLLNAKYTLQHVSQTLGHSSIESTKPYIRIDLQTLAACVLEVPKTENEVYDNLKMK